MADDKQGERSVKRRVRSASGDIIECAFGYQAEVSWGCWTAYTAPTLTQSDAVAAMNRLAGELNLKLNTPNHKLCHGGANA